MTDGQTRDWMKDERLTLARESISRTEGFAHATLRWITTSTLGLNSAALLASLSSDQFANKLLAFPAWFFVAGIGLSLFGPLSMMIGFAGMASQMAETLWRGEGIEEDNMDKFDPNADRFIVLGAALSGLAVAAFLVGAILSGVVIHMQIAASSQVPQ